MNKGKAFFLFLCVFTLTRQLPARNDITRKAVPSRSIQKNVDLQVMERIYQEIKTPYKYGIILKGDNNSKLDCPSVFRFGESWYMMYIIFNGNGYETAIAQSTDLITWKPIGKILRFQPGRWDANQAAGYVALQDFDWGGSYKLQKYNDKYWLSYIGGALKGYETDPLSIGIAWTNNPTKPIEWRTRRNVDFRSANIGRLAGGGCCRKNAGNTGRFCGGR